MLKKLELENKYTTVYRVSTKQSINRHLTLRGKSETELFFTTIDGDQYVIQLQPFIHTTVVDAEEVRTILMEHTEFQNDIPQELKLVYILGTIDGQVIYIFEEPKVPNYDFNDLLLDEEYYLLYYGKTGINMNDRGVLTYKGDGVKFITPEGVVWFPNKGITNKINYKGSTLWSDFVLEKLGVTKKEYNEPVYEFNFEGGYVIVLKGSGELLAIDKGN